MMGNFSIYISSGSPGFTEQDQMEFHMEEAGTSEINIFSRNKTSKSSQEGGNEVEESVCGSLPLEVANQEIKKISDHQNYFLEKELLQCYKKSLEEGNLLSDDTDVIILDMIEIEKEIEDPVEEFLKSVTPQKDTTLQVENQVERRQEASKALLELASSCTEFDTSSTFECAKEKDKTPFENVSVLKKSIGKNSKLGNLICEDPDSEVTLSGDEICDHKVSNDDKLFYTDSPYNENDSCSISDHNYCLPYSAWMKLPSSIQQNEGTADSEVVCSVPYVLKQIISDHEYSKTQYTYPPTFKPSSPTKVTSRFKTKQKPHLLRNSSKDKKHWIGHLRISLKKKKHKPNRKKVAAAIEKKHEGVIGQSKANIGGNIRKACAKVCKKYEKKKPAQIVQNKKPFSKYKSKEFIRSSSESYSEKNEPIQIVCDKKPFSKYKSKEFISSCSESSSESSSETTTTTSSDSIFNTTSDSSSDSSNDEDKPLNEIKIKLAKLRNKNKGKKNNFICNRNKLSSGKPISVQIEPSSKPKSVCNSLIKDRNSKKKCENPSKNKPVKSPTDSHKKKCVNSLSNSFSHEAQLKKLVVVLEDCMKSDNITNLLYNKDTFCSKNKSSSYKSVPLQNSSPSNLSSNSFNSVSKKRKSTKKNCANSSDATTHEINSKKLFVVLEDCMKSIKFRTKLSPTRDLINDKNSSDLESMYVREKNEQTSLSNIANETNNLCPNSEANYSAKIDTFVSENSEKDISQISGSESINPECMFSNSHSSFNDTENVGVFSYAKECINEIHHDDGNETEMADDSAISQLISDTKNESLHLDESFNSDSEVELLCERVPTAEIITLEEADEVESTVIS